MIKTSNYTRISLSVLLIIALFTMGLATSAAADGPATYQGTPSPVMGVTDSIFDSSGGGSITMDVRGIDMRDLMSALAVKMGVNIVMVENTSPKVTLQVKDTTPRQALELALQSQGLDYIQQGDIIVVGKPGTLKSDFFSQMVLTRFNTYFITSSELEKLIKDLGIPLKSVTMGSNPNVIWCQGTVQELKKVRELIYAVDTVENQQTLEFRTLTLTQISPDRAVEMLYQAGIYVTKFVLLDNRLLVFDRELFPRWGQVEQLFKSLDVQEAIKQKAFVYQLKNIAAADAANRLNQFGYQGVTTITSNIDKFSREIIVVCPPYLESQVRSALMVLDGTRQKVRVPVHTLSGNGAHSGLNSMRSLLSEMSGVPVGSMNISGNLSGDSDKPEYVLWVEESPDKIQLIKDMIDEM